MYITLIFLVLAVGLLLLFIPYRVIKRWSESKVFSVCLRLFGLILILIGIITIYAMLSGTIVLPLIK